MLVPSSTIEHFFLFTYTESWQAIVFTNVFTPATDGFTEDTKLYNDNAYKVDMGIDSNQTETNGEFALTFRSTLNEEFTTQTMNVYNVTEWDVEEAINALPNKVCRSYARK